MAHQAATEALAIAPRDKEPREASGDREGPREQLAVQATERKVELTATLAERMVQEAESEDERQLAQAWSRQARNLIIRLDMPVTGREAKRSHRQSIAQQLEELQADMNRHLAS